MLIVCGGMYVCMYVCMYVHVRVCPFLSPGDLCVWCVYVHFHVHVCVGVIFPVLARPLFDRPSSVCSPDQPAG